MLRLSPPLPPLAFPSRLQIFLPQHFRGQFAVRVAFEQIENARRRFCAHQALVKAQLVDIPAQAAIELFFIICLPRALKEGFLHEAFAQNLLRARIKARKDFCPLRYAHAAALPLERHKGEAHIAGIQPDEQSRIPVLAAIAGKEQIPLPIYDIARLCRERGVPLIVDASQSAGALDVDYGRLGADFIAMPGHKGLFGPQGTGILICSGTCKPLLSGGSGTDSIVQHMPDYLPDRLEAGTHNVCGIAGLLEGIRFVRQKGIKEIFDHESGLLRRMVGQLQQVRGLELFTENCRAQSGVLSLRTEKLNCEDLASALSDRGICVRTGLHCSPYAHRSAGTLESGTVRFSFSPFNTQEEVDICCQFIKDLL